MDGLGKILLDLAGKFPPLREINHARLLGKIRSELTPNEDVLTTAASCAAFTNLNSEYAQLAGRIVAFQIQREVPRSFWENLVYVDRRGKIPSEINGCYRQYDYSEGIFRPEVMKFAARHRKTLESMIIPDRDFSFDFFGISTLRKSYLIKLKSGDSQETAKLVETPQYMFMRVALGIHVDENSGEETLHQIYQTYEAMSQHKIIHASPTLFNCGLRNGQLSSCFLLPMADDSLDRIFDTVKDVAMISKGAGGIGLSVQNIRGSGARLGKTDGVAGGLVPMLKIFNEVARYVDQGGGKRKGAITVYLEPWHPDVMDVLNLKTNQGSEELKARDLFYAMWVPDLFMRRVRDCQMWSLFMPHKCPELYQTWGPEFERHYLHYEKSGMAVKTLPAREIMEAIIRSQVETGGPFMLYKDHCNRKSNHQHLGTIRSANLCTEIVQYSSAEETATCNLASISLPGCLVEDEETGELKFSYQELYCLTQQLVLNLNRVIDVNHYSLETARISNVRHRPMAIGVQGLADVFMRLKLPFTSEPAREINRRIFQTIYFAALRQSVDMAEKFGPYPSYQGSPLSQGILQQDMWGVKVDSDDLAWDWAKLRRDLAQFGARNSLLVGPMPTASTSQILGNMECFEPQTSNMYTRRVLAGEFVVINRHLINHLMELGLWNEEIRQEIIQANGSVQAITKIPAEVREIYKTVWEIRQRDLIDMARDRAVFIDQSQSLSIYMENPNFTKLAACHLHAWESGLKTGMYYLRTRPAVDPIKFTLKEPQLVCSLENSECLMCSS